MNLEFISKEEIEDEYKQKLWVYKCKHCNSALLTANLNMLAFIQAYEEEQNKTEKKQS